MMEEYLKKYVEKKNTSNEADRFDKLEVGIHIYMKKRSQRSYA